ncbi:glycosyltransferase family 2 protein [Candidatus Pelagibacter bacterium nBUS_27]|uniref:glycosyltransferase family 2 protein n=1 Tax=Candidatus Pelagibacter bacterium nBUS_27 TaxID=3374188 RepID=UPI003EB8A201
MKNFKLSIIIPTWNRKAKLTKLLKRIISKINVNNIKYEIIICDSYSTDGSQKLIKKIFGKNKKIIYINVKKNIISLKRNSGLKISKYQNILLLDDDCLPIGNFFTDIKNYLENSKYNQIFCGQYSTQKKLILKSNYHRFRNAKNIKTNEQKKINYKNIITGCCFFNKKKISKKLYFNENIQGYGLEDIEWAFRLNKRKFEIILTKVKVDHQETSQNIGAYVIKWYTLSKDAMLSLSKRYRNTMKSRIFYFERLFDKKFIKLFFKILNILIIKPLSFILKKYLIGCDRTKILYSYNLFEFLIFLYYLRGAIDRDKFLDKDKKWYEAGYK